MMRKRREVLGRCRRSEESRPRKQRSESECMIGMGDEEASRHLERSRASPICTDEGVLSFRSHHCVKQCH